VHSYFYLEYCAPCVRIMAVIRRFISALLILLQDSAPCVGLLRRIMTRIRPFVSKCILTFTSEIVPCASASNTYHGCDPCKCTLTFTSEIVPCASASSTYHGRDPSTCTLTFTSEIVPRCIGLLHGIMAVIRTFMSKCTLTLPPTVPCALILHV
jgi:hypothetical protein